jgi:type VII secretion-associated protein (TIGR03931 family)
MDAALSWIDDPVGLLDERPVAVADIWRSLIAVLVGGCCDSVVVVHPPEWPRHRVDRVLAAANAVADHVEAVSSDRWTEPTDDELSDDAARRRRIYPRLRPVIAGVVGAGVAAVTALAGVQSAHTPDTDAGMSVAEGRMTVRIPAGWTVERVTGGPGSRRLQVSPPGDPDIAVHLTSSYAPEATLERAAEVVSAAIAAEPPGVFVDVRPLDEVAGRPAVTYREVRPGHVIAWSVVLTGATRISVGCQSPPGREADVRLACDEAVRTARET